MLVSSYRRAAVALALGVLVSLGCATAPPPRPCVCLRARVVVDGNRAIRTSALRDAWTDLDGRAFAHPTLAYYEIDEELFRLQASVRARYRELGYIRADVRVDPEWSRDHRVVVLRAHIDEGRQYRIGHAETLVVDEERHPIAFAPPDVPRVRAGEPLSPPRIDAIEEAIRKRYAERGHALADVYAAIYYDDVAARGNVQMRIRPGPRCTIAALRFVARDGRDAPAEVARLGVRVGERFVQSKIDRAVEVAKERVGGAEDVAVRVSADRASTDRVIVTFFVVPRPSEP